MNKKVKKIILSLLTLSIISLPVIEGAVTVKAATNNATINISSKKQLIMGFGGSSAWCGALNDTCMNSLYNNYGYSILRVRIDPNEGWNKGDFKRWADELSNAKKAVARGAIVFATPWSPPASMKTNNSIKGQGSLKTSSYADYANYLKAFVKYFADNGVPLYAMSLQNEPDWRVDYDGCLWTGNQFHDFLKDYGSTLSKTIKIIMPESLNFSQSMSDPTLNDPTTASYISIVGGHLYGSNPKDYPLARSKGKELWMTEKNFDGDDTNTLMTMAKEINDCMTVGNMNAYVYWWILNDGNGLYTKSGIPTKKANVLAQYAKFIRPGYNRVDATSSPQSNVYVSAYTGNKKAVIVAINKGTSQVNQSFTIQNEKTSSVETWRTSTSLNVAKGDNINVSNGNFTASLPAESVTTFVGDIN